MKPERLIPDEPERPEVVAQAPDYSRKLIDSIVPFKGHTMFEINCSTGEIVPATYETIVIDFNTKAVRKKIIIKPNCLYISCLNKKSARKKYLNWLVEKGIDKYRKNKINE